MLFTNKLSLPTNTKSISGNEDGRYRVVKRFTEEQRIIAEMVKMRKKYLSRYLHKNWFRISYKQKRKECTFDIAYISIYCYVASMIYHYLFTVIAVTSCSFYLGISDYPLVLG